MSLKKCHHQNKESLPTSSNPYFSCATCNLKPKPRAFGRRVGFGPGASSRGGVVSCGVVNPDDRSTNLIDPVDGVMLHLWCFFWYNYWISLNIEYYWCITIIDTSRRKKQGFSLHVFFSKPWGQRIEVSIFQTGWRNMFEMVIATCVLTEKQWRKFCQNLYFGFGGLKKNLLTHCLLAFLKIGKTYMLESKLSLPPRRFSEERNNQHLRSSFRKLLWCFGCPGGVSGGQSARSPHSARTGALSARAAKENEESEDSAVKWMLKWMSGLDH